MGHLSNRKTLPKISTRRISFFYQRVSNRTISIFFSRNFIQVKETVIYYFWNWTKIFRCAQSKLKLEKAKVGMLEKTKMVDYLMEMKGELGESSEHLEPQRNAVMNEYRELKRKIEPLSEAFDQRGVKI